jgi:hypothetical protein
LNPFTGGTIQPQDPAADGRKTWPVVQVSAAGEPTARRRRRFVPLGDGSRIDHVATGLALTAQESDGEVRVVVAPWDGRDEL